MSDVDAAPAAENDIAESAPLSEVLSGDRHERTREVGEGDAPAAAAVAAAPVAEAPPAAAAPAPAPVVDPATDPKSPKWFREGLKEANRRALEAETAAERLRNTPAPAPAAPRAATTLPNPAEDPQGYHEAVQAQYRRDMQEFQLRQTLTVSERFAKQQFGGETFEDCRAWLSTKPEIENMALQQPDPWGFAMSHYQRDKLAEEIGDDPAAYRKRVEDEIRAEYEARHAAAPAAPAPPPTMHRPAPPAPASTARSAAPRDGGGRFMGPTPIGQLSKNKFG